VLHVVSILSSYTHQHNHVPWKLQTVISLYNYLDPVVTSYFLVARNLPRILKLELWIHAFPVILLAWGICSHPNQRTVKLLAYLL
jgi:hypothetical protein